MEIKEFNWKKMKLPCAIAIIGRTQTGKSTIAKLISYYHQHKFRLVMFISDTADVNEDFKDIIPDCMTFTSFPRDKIMELFNHQRYIISQKKKGNKKYKDTVTDALVITDDMTADTKWLNYPEVKKFGYEGRWWGITWIFCTQDLMSIPSKLREAIGYIIVMRQQNDKVKRKFFEHYWSDSDLLDYSSFCNILRICTEPFKCLVIDKKAKGSDIKDMVFCGNSIPKEEIPTFRLGSRKLWKAHNKLYDSNWEERSFMKNKKNVGVIIKKKS